MSRRWPRCPGSIRTSSDGKILHYDSPQYAHYSKAFAQGLGKKGYFAFAGAYVFVPMWNTENLDFHGTSWWDVIGAVPDKRLSIGDATKSETSRATYLVLRRVLGKEYFEKLAKMSPNLILRSENVAERLVSGEDLMAAGGMPTRAYQFNERGAKLKFILPKEGVVLLPEATFILADAPHPNAAKLWVDFVLSEAGQKIIVTARGADFRSRRVQEPAAGIRAGDRQHQRDPGQLGKGHARRHARRRATNGPACSCIEVGRACDDDDLRTLFGAAVAIWLGAAGARWPPIRRRSRMRPPPRRRASNR